MSEHGKGLELDIADKIKIAIEYCLMKYMTKQECLDSVCEECNFNRSAVECVWRRLQSENQQFFDVYYLRMELKNQIVRFNTLLSQQLEMMKSSGSMGHHHPSSGQYISAPNAQHLHYECSTSYGHHSSNGYAQIPQHLLMPQHGNESMFNTTPGSLLQPSANMLMMPHNQIGPLFHPSAEVAHAGYVGVFQNDLIHQNMGGASSGYAQASTEHGLNSSLIHPAMTGAFNLYDQISPSVLTSQNTDNGSFLQPSLAGVDFNGSVQISPSMLLTSHNENVVLNSQLGTDRAAYDDDRSNLMFIPTPHTRNATTSTGLSSSMLLTSHNGNMLLNSQLETERAAYDGDRSNLVFIPTPHNRTAATSTGLLPSGRQHRSGDSSSGQHNIHGTDLPPPLSYDT